MTWLIACERSGRIRDAMLARGIDAVSCDIEPTRSPGPHIQGDALEQIGKRWAGVIAHPPCTYLTNAANRWLYVGGKGDVRDPVRWSEMESAARFFRAFLGANAPLIAIENPIMGRHAAQRVGTRATQFVQPWWFGEPMFKATGFHLIGLPNLTPTDKLTPPKPGTDEHKRWSWVHRLPPGPDRTEKRSETAQGIADAIAAQWGAYADLATEAAA